MNKTSCLIVDDEPPAVELLERYVGMVESLELVASSYSGVKAFSILKEKEIDLMLLDIRMPVLNGIDFIKTLKKPPAIILTTAYREYALEAYDLDIIDYLLKPISFDRFLKAVDRYHARSSSSHALVNTTVAPQSPAYIFCNVNRTHHKVYLKDILYIESLKDYVRIHTQEEKLVVKGNIGSFMKQLPEQDFIRIHRSYAIAIQHLKAYNQSEVSIAGVKLPIGHGFRDDFNARVL